MINEVFDLYKSNLPDIVRSEKTVRKLLSDTNNHIIEYRDGGKLAGVSVINENTIYLLCVGKPFRGKGIGAELLAESEEYIIRGGFDKIILGAGKDYIMPGVPMNYGAHYYFAKRGYIHSWGDCGCFDMELELKDFAYNEHSIGDTINGIMYKWAALDDVGRIVRCVSDAEEKFVPYYQDEAVYKKGTNTPALIAETGGEVLGALIVSIETEGKDMGSVGCTATRHKSRGKGIATTMVTLGTKYLKGIGLSKAHLGYTYTDIVSLYGRAGYKVCMEYFMGEKAVGNTYV